MFSHTNHIVQKVLKLWFIVPISRNLRSGVLTSLCLSENLLTSIYYLKACIIMVIIHKNAKPFYAIKRFKCMIIMGISSIQIFVFTRKSLRNKILVGCTFWILSNKYLFHKQNIESIHLASKLCFALISFVILPKCKSHYTYTCYKV